MSGVSAFTLEELVGSAVTVKFDTDDVSVAVVLSASINVIRVI
jgi:hypothetical protein